MKMVFIAFTSRLVILQSGRVMEPVTRMEQHISGIFTGNMVAHVEIACTT